jgi:cobalamin biosynthesis protein CobW
VTPRIPVLLVSGFLGSGKTALVRHLLARAQREGVRVAVVSNELGELGIDRALLADAGQGAVELAGGCICCKLSDDFVATLESLRERARPERVIVETSGVALPYEAQLHLWREPVARWLGDDVVVVVVNAERLAQGLDADEVFAQQVSSADLLLLNQLDRVEPAEIPRLEARLRALEPDAPIVHAVHARIEPDLLFPPDPGGRRLARRARPVEPATHLHDAFTSEEIALPAGLSSEALREHLRALGALRIKGFAQTREGLRVVQAIGARIELLAADAPPRPELLNRAVAIRRATTA